jgi:uncharacterized protein YcaQ
MPAAARSKGSIISASEAARLLLGRQGLLDDPARAAGRAEVATLVHDMGFIQIDSINVVERAHHLTLANRLDAYRPSMLAALLEETRELFEHWTHDASAIPTVWFPHWRHQFERRRRRIRANAWWRQRIGPRPNKLIEAVKQRIADHGPLLSRDFETATEREQRAEKGWWGWKPQKAALEYLWHVGELVVCRRINFQKVYDLTERVLPARWIEPRSDPREHVEWACRSALWRLGAATPGELAAFWRAITPAQAARWCAAAARAGEIVPVEIKSMRDARPRRSFAPADWRDMIEALPEPPARIRLLSPFDPILRDRARTTRLFDFEYSFEAFVPAAKRQFGYYVLPILERDRLIGRLDPKLHRERGELEIKGLWWEPKIKPTRARRSALDAAVERLASFVGAARIAWRA